jgi:hypothetical protein
MLKKTDLKEWYVPSLIRASTHRRMFTYQTLLLQASVLIAAGRGDYEVMPGIELHEFRAGMLLLIELKRIEGIKGDEYETSIRRQDRGLGREAT